MSELVEFLRARVDEDEARARAAGEARIAWLTYRDASGQMLYTTVASAESDDVWIAAGEGFPVPASVLVVYDPACVLAEVEAKRRIMARHCRAPFWADTPSMRDACQGCGCSGPMEYPNTDHLDECPELRDLASVYAGHDDYMQKWAPEAPR